MHADVLNTYDYTETRNKTHLAQSLKGQGSWTRYNAVCLPLTQRGEPVRREKPKPA